MGIDYGMGQTNIDKANGIRYGVISQNAVLQAWADSSEPNYGKPVDGWEGECPNCGAGLVANKDTDWGDILPCQECADAGDDGEVEVELPDCADPVSHFIDDGEYLAEAGEDGDIFITKSPFYTRAEFCSPCAPGACYLESPSEDGVRAYCFGADWFDDESPCPYPLYRVDTDELVYTPAPDPA